MAKLVETTEGSFSVEFTQLETELFHDLSDTLNKDYHLMVFEYMRTGIPVELPDQPGEFTFKYHGIEPANMIISAKDTTEKEEIEELDNKEAEAQIDNVRVILTRLYNQAYARALVHQNEAPDLEVRAKQVREVLEEIYLELFGVYLDKEEKVVEETVVKEEEGVLVG